MHLKTLPEDTKINVFLYFAVVTVNIAGFGLGATYSWSSPAIPKLNGKVDPADNPLSSPISPYEESWIASLLPLGSAISCFLYGYLADKIGRKRTLLLSMVPTIAGFILIIFGNDVFYFYIGRFLNGLGQGAMFTVIPMYVGEISQNYNRGILGCLFVVFINLGNVFTYSVGPYVTVRILSICNAVIPVLFLVLFGLLVPESPYYWVAKNRPEEAEKSLMKLRYNSLEIVKRELPEIHNYVEESLAKRRGIKDLFRERGLFKAFCITGGLNIFQQICGSNFIYFYMHSLFQETESAVPADIAVIIVSVFRLVASVVSSSLVDKLGRRVLLLASAAGMAVSLVCFGVYFLLKENQMNIDSVYWLPMVSIISYVVTFAFGFGSVPYTILGEIFPTHVKSLASSLTIFICLFFMFVVTNFFPLLITVIGMMYAFFLLSFFCVLGGVFTYFFVPETKGKSLQEIQIMLQR